MSEQLPLPLESPEAWPEGLDPILPPPLCDCCEDHLYLDAWDIDIDCPCTY